MGLICEGRVALCSFSCFSELKRVGDILTVAAFLEPRAPIKFSIVSGVAFTMQG